MLDREGFKGTSAQISRNPSEWRAERELAKIDGNPIKEAHVANNEQLTSKWESLVDETGATPTDNVSRMESTFQTLKQGDEAAQADISAKYNAAREMSGNDLPLNHMRFIDQASRELDEAQLGSFVPAPVLKVFKEMFQTPTNPRFTYDKSESLIKILNAEYAKADRAKDGNVKTVIGIIRDKLSKEVDDTIEELGGSLGNGVSDGGLAGTKEAYQSARNAARERFQNLDTNPALRAALDDASPDRSFKSLVLGADKRDLIKLVDELKDTPQGKQNLADLQGATIEHFIKKATMADGGAFNTAKLNKAIDDFTPEKMRALFTPEQIARINDVQKVGNILMRQPLGSPINHAGTSSSLINALIGIAGGLGRIPFGGGHLANIATGGVSTVVDMSKKGAATTATARALSGQPSVTKGSSLGLTEEQLRLLGMLPAAGQAGAAVVANVGD